MGGDYYMTASSFNAAPGLPILHSKDLVNWALVNYALPKVVPEEVFAVPQHGNGVWAPNIRYHQGRYWIFYPDPDFGIYVVTAEHPTKSWSSPKLILAGKGLIDPTPLWDEDGKAYLLHGWAKSRAGFNNVLTLHRMSADGSTVAPEGKVIVDGHKIPGFKTLEGPKFYKRNGYYYIFAPAGGVPVGWQTVFRSENVEGPYEVKTVLEQGDTLVNGPHQGAWVETPEGEDWFVHFQSKGAYGRVVHLQPMKWNDDWPVIGVDANNDGIGNPVSVFRKPKTQAPQEVANLPFRDDFSADKLALQWQWNGNYQSDWFSLLAKPDRLRLYPQPSANFETQNLWLSPSVLLQKLPGPQFAAQTTLTVSAEANGISAGMVMFGEDYRWVGIKVIEGKALLGGGACSDARVGCTEEFVPEKELPSREATLRMTVGAGGLVVLGYLSLNGRFHALPELFQARPGRWVGAKIGVFARSDFPQAEAGFVDVRGFDLSGPAATH